MATKRRKKELKPDPNPLFKTWIREWKDEAERKGWKTKYVYAKALKSLEHFPLVLKSGKEALILESFGEKICQMLDDKLAEYKASGGVIACVAPVLSVDSDSDDSLPNTCTEAITSSSPAKKSKAEPAKRKTQKQWIPAPGTAAYAILIAMYNGQIEQNLNYFKKAEVIARAQPFSETSFTLPNPGSHYTAWSSMGVLIKKEMATKEGNPPRYGLTEIGIELASKLLTASQKNSTCKVSISNGHCESDEESIQSTQPSQDLILSSQEEVVDRWTLEPGTFDIILCVDNCETAGGGEAVVSRKQLIIQELHRNGVVFEVRKLHVGDFLWIAKERVQPVPGQLRTKEPQELVLDFVVERKRLDDLAKSIKDGRFHEQKFRLQNSGVRRPVYLVEDYGNDSYQYGIPRQALFQAINNTQVINGFTVQKTRDQKDSAAYLTLMTRALSRTYSCRKLQSCTHSEIKEKTCPPNSFLKFKDFNNSSMKNKVMTAKEMFVKQLVQLSGLSVEKAAAITDLYDTPYKLLAAFENCEKQEEKMLAGIKYGQNKRNLGPAISKVLYRFYMTEFMVE